MKIRNLDYKRLLKSSMIKGQYLWGVRQLSHWFELLNETDRMQRQISLVYNWPITCCRTPPTRTPRLPQLHYGSVIMQLIARYMRSASCNLSTLWESHLKWAYFIGFSRSFISITSFTEPKLIQNIRYWCLSPKDIQHGKRH